MNVTSADVIYAQLAIEDILIYTQTDKFLRSKINELFDK